MLDLIQKDYKQKRGEYIVMVIKTSDFLKALIDHNEIGGSYQIHLNSDCLDEKNTRNTGIEIGDLYFTECSAIKDHTLLCFGNLGKKPIRKSEDGTDLYPVEINSNMFIDISKIESVEDVEDFQDWFYLPSKRVINVLCILRMMILMENGM